MIAFKPTVDRLKAAGFPSVEGVLELMQVINEPRIQTAVYVVPERESAQPNRNATGVVDQKVTETFSVVIAVETARLPDKVSEALTSDSRTVEDAIIGWRHPEASGPCEYVGGRLLSLEGRRVVWAITFSASRHIRKASQ